MPIIPTFQRSIQQPSYQFVPTVTGEELGQVGEQMMRDQIAMARVQHAQDMTDAIEATVKRNQIYKQREAEAQQNPDVLASMSPTDFAGQWDAQAKQDDLSVAETLRTPGARHIFDLHASRMQIAAFDRDSRQHQALWRDRQEAVTMGALNDLAHSAGSEADDQKRQDYIDQGHALIAQRVKEGVMLAAPAEKLKQQWDKQALTNHADFLINNHGYDKLDQEMDAGKFDQLTEGEKLTIDQRNRAARDRANIDATKNDKAVVDQFLNDHLDLARSGDPQAVDKFIADSQAAGHRLTFGQVQEIEKRMKEQRGFNHNEDSDEANHIKSWYEDAKLNNGGLSNAGIAAKANRMLNDSHLDGKTVATLKRELAGDLQHAGQVNENRQLRTETRTRADTQRAVRQIFDKGLLSPIQPGKVPDSNSYMDALNAGQKTKDIRGMTADAMSSPDPVGRANQLLLMYKQQHQPPKKKDDIDKAIEDALKNLK